MAIEPRVTTIGIEVESENARQPRITTIGVAVESENNRQVRITSLGIQIEYELKKTSSKHAYTEAPLPSASDNKTAYLTGTSEASGSAHTYIGGTSTSTSNKTAYLSGYSTSSDSNTAYLTSSPLFEIDWIAVGIPAFGTIATTSHAAYLNSIIPERSSAQAYLLPNATTSGSKSAYSNGSSTSLDSSSAYTSGIEQVTSSKSVYLSGINQATSNKQAYTTGSSSTTSSKHSYLSGQVASSKHAYATGGGGGSKHAYLNGSIFPAFIGWESGGVEYPLDKVYSGTPYFTSTAAQTGSYGMQIKASAWQGVKNQTQFTTCSEFTIDFSIYLASLSNIYSNPGSFDLAYIQQQAYVSNVWRLNLYRNSTISTSWNIQVVFPNQYSPLISISTNAWHDIRIAWEAGTGANGFGQLSVDGTPLWQNSHIQTSGFNASTVWIGAASYGDAYYTSGTFYYDDVWLYNTAEILPGLTCIDSNKSAYASGGAVTTSSKHAMIVGSVKASKPAYLYGTSRTKPAYLNGIAPTTSNKSAYALGSPTVTSNKSAYIASIRAASDYMLVYLSGYNTSTSNKSSYMFGVVEESSSTHAFCPGAQASPTSHKHAYIGTLNYRSSKNAYIGESLPGAAMTQAYITLADSTGTTVHNFRVIHEGYTDGELEKAGSVEPTIGGGVDVSMGAVRKKWEPIIKCYGTDESNYGTRSDLEWYFSLNNPNGTPSNVISMTDHHGSTHFVYMIDTLQANLLTTYVEGSQAVFHVKVRMIEANV